MYPKLFQKYRYSWNRVFSLSIDALLEVMHGLRRASSIIVFGQQANGARTSKRDRYSFEHSLTYRYIDHQSANEKYLSTKTTHESHFKHYMWRESC